MSNRQGNCTSTILPIASAIIPDIIIITVPMATAFVNVLFLMQYVISIINIIALAQKIGTVKWFQ